MDLKKSTETIALMFRVKCGFKKGPRAQEEMLFEDVNVTLERR